MLQDLKFTLRLWSGRPWHVGLAIAALAIGIGANTGVFSVVNALLFRTLPFREPDRLALFQQFQPPHDTPKQFHDWAQQNTYLEDAALLEEADVNLGGLRSTTRAHAVETSWNFFGVLGRQPVLGRGFLPGDETEGSGWGPPGPNAVAVIGYGLWQQVFGGDRSALGATIRIDGHALTVVGVAPPEFDYPNKAVLWKPAVFSPGNNGWVTIARLKAGIGWPQAKAAFGVDPSQPPRSSESSNALRPSMTSLRDGLAGPTKKASQMFQWAVLLVLLIACSNVANLLISRTLDRASELSIRSALGATPTRLARQLLIECLLLTCVAAFVGLLLAFWITSLAAKVAPPALDIQAYSLLDKHVLGFTLLISLITALALGVLPSLFVDRLIALRSSSFTKSRGTRLLRESMLVTQVILSMVLLASSVSLGHAFGRLMRIDRGYAVTGIATVNVSLEGTTHQLERRQLPYFEAVVDRLRQIPWVRSASATEFLPLYASAFVGGQFGLDGRVPRRNSSMIPVLSGYFQTMGGQVLYGREFSEAEVRSAAPVAVVNERFAEQFGAPQDAVGRQLTIEGDSPRKIVGVVKGMEYETDPTLFQGTQVFVPSSTPGSFFSTFVIRVDGHAEDRLAAIRDAIESVDPQVPVFGVKTMEQRLHEVFAAPEFFHAAIWSLAGFALLLAVIGTYAVVAYAVVQRTSEMGVRLALGTTPANLRGILLRQGLLLVAGSAVAGMATAQFTGLFLDRVIEHARPISLLTSSGLVAFFTVVSAASIWWATCSIASLDIVSILRSE